MSTPQAKNIDYRLTHYNGTCKNCYRDKHPDHLHCCQVCQQSPGKHTQECNIYHDMAKLGNPIL